MPRQPVNQHVTLGGAADRRIKTKVNSSLLMVTYSPPPKQYEKQSQATLLDDRPRNRNNQVTMERPSFFFSPFVDVKPRNIPPYPPPLTPAVKQPITPTPRVPITKPTSSYRIDDILSKPDPPPPAGVPTAAHFRAYPAVPPPRRYGYGPNVPLLWSAMLQSQWRDRFNGM